MIICPPFIPNELGERIDYTNHIDKRRQIQRIKQPHLQFSVILL